MEWNSTVDRRLARIRLVARPEELATNLIRKCDDCTQEMWKHILHGRGYPRFGCAALWAESSIYGCTTLKNSNSRSHSRAPVLRDPRRSNRCGRSGVTVRAAHCRASGATAGRGRAAAAARVDACVVRDFILFIHATITASAARTISHSNSTSKSALCLLDIDGAGSSCTNAAGARCALAISQPYTSPSGPGHGPSSAARILFIDRSAGRTSCRKPDRPQTPLAWNKICSQERQ